MPGRLTAIAWPPGTGAASPGSAGSTAAASAPASWQLVPLQSGCVLLTEASLAVSCWDLTVQWLPFT